jgi:hypothetical protein
MLVNGENVDKNVRTLTLISSKEDKRSNVNVKYHTQANYLISKFEKIGCPDAKGCYNYFVKCFKSLSENTIWSIYESATNNPTVHSPIKYFIAACRNQMNH